MAKTLCRVAGGGKPLKGNAEAGDVLAGKTFSNKQSNALTGSMPNNGAWSASTSGNGSVTIPAGYHNGSGTVSGSASYNSGYAKGKNDGYNSGYANGVTNGKAGARLVLISQTSFGNYETKTINISSGILIWAGDVKKYDCFMKSKSSVSHLIDAYGKGDAEEGNPISLQSATDTTVTFNGRYGTLNAYQIQ